jgi:aspartyl/asparaginyl beta-hydroxylase (cupin superfamily)
MAKVRKNIVRLHDWLTMPALIGGLKLSSFLIGRTSNGRTSVFDPGAFAWTVGLEARWEAMRIELEALLEHHERIPELHKLIPGRYSVAPEWKTYFFYGFGRRFDRNCEECPETAAALGEVPDLQTAFFSILPPRTRIPPHVGIYGGYLRYHLGLIVPEPERCGLRIVDQTLHWSEGGSLIFCDQFRHEAWNDTEQFRAVLIVDVLRPLSGALGALNRWVVRRISHTEFIRSTERRLRDFGRQSAP